MNLMQLLMEGQHSLTDASGRIYGVVIGIVTENKDTDSQDQQDSDKRGKVKVRFPWLSEKEGGTWARVATLMAGNDRGIFYLPEVEDEVLVAFEHGDVRYPYVLGALWNGKDKPPATNADGKNNKRLIKSRSGMTILLDDTSGSEKIEIADKDSQNKIMIDMANKKISITSNGDIELNASQGNLSLTAKAIKFNSTGETEIKATGTLNIQGQTVNVKGQPTINLN
jgi:uncharacterized protein involved in type VI secretion and phage assembly